MAGPRNQYQKELARDVYGNERRFDYYRDPPRDRDPRDRDRDFRDRERYTDLKRSEKAEKASFYRQKEQDTIKLHADYAGATQKISGLEKDLTRSEERTNKLEAKLDAAEEKNKQLQETILELKTQIMKLELKHRTSPYRDHQERNVRPRPTVTREDNSEEPFEAEELVISNARYVVHYYD